LALDLDADFRLRDLDDNGNPDGWTSAVDYLHKIEHLRWNTPADPFFIQVATVDGYTLGHGLLMEDYDPSLFHPYVVQRGLTAGLDGSVLGVPAVGAQLMADDVLDWDVIASRVWVAPLGFMVSGPARLTVGLSGVLDLDNQEEPLSDQYGPPRDHPSSETVSSVAVDAQLYVLDGEETALLVYADWAHIVNRGSGVLAGAELSYRWLLLRGEVRFSGSGFVPHFFDPYYELERSVRYAELDLAEASTGWLAATELDLFGAVGLAFSWEQEFDGGAGPRIRWGLGLSPEAFPKLSASLSYDKRGVADLGDFLELQDSLFSLSAAYRVTPSVLIRFTQARVFAPWGSSTSQTVLETRFRF
ncbi:MAG: hypothetical protein ACOC8N_08605, partial [Spirochaetota bacterium]